MLMKAERQFKGIWIPAEIWESNDLSIMEKVLLAEVESLSQKGKGCFASNAYLAKFFGVSERHISRYLGQLVAKNYIKIVIDKTKGNDRIVYTLWTNLSIPYGQKCPDPIDKNVHHITKNITKVITKNNVDAKNEFLHTDINLENQTTTDPKTPYLKENQDKTSSATSLPKPPAKDWLPGQPLPTNFGQWTSQMFIQSINEAKKPEHSRELLNTFYNYWTQKDKSGRYGFQIEKKWSTALRLATFYRNETTGKFDQPNYKPSFPKTT